MNNLATDVNREQFSVAQFFGNGAFEYVRRYVSAQEAARAFAHYSRSVAARQGFVVRVIITDGGDCIAIEWQHGKGYTYNGMTWAERPVMMDGRPCHRPP